MMYVTTFSGCKARRRRSAASPRSRSEARSYSRAASAGVMRAPDATSASSPSMVVSPLTLRRGRAGGRPRSSRRMRSDGRSLAGRPEARCHSSTKAARPDNSCEPSSWRRKCADATKTGTSASAADKRRNRPPRWGSFGASACATHNHETNGRPDRAIHSVTVPATFPRLCSRAPAMSAGSAA